MKKENTILTELPRKNNGSVDWEKCIGIDVKIHYSDNDYIVKVENVFTKNGKKYISVGYDGRVNDIYSHNFLKCAFGKILGFRNSDFLYSVGESIGNLQILDREIIKFKRKDGKIENIKTYKFKCLNCQFDSDTEYYDNNKEFHKGGYIMRESVIKKGGGCPCCCSSPKVVAPEINSIWATDKWMLQWIDEDEAKKYTKRSHKNIKVKCSDCEKEKEITLGNLYNNKTISCSCCGGMSYSEKMLFNMISQLGVEFVYEYTTNWCKDKRYDFYIPSLNTIIETHGLQHYEYTGFNRNLEEEQNNDRLKEQIAKENGVENYIVLDCRRSDMKWIKNSILNSKLNELFSLSKIDWDKCEEFALSNLVKKVCDYWNRNYEIITTSIVSKHFNLSHTTIKKYLNIGNDIGWLEIPYVGKAEHSRQLSLLSEKKKVNVYDKEMNLLYTSESIRDCSKWLVTNGFIVDLKCGEEIIRRKINNENNMFISKINPEPLYMTLV